MNRRKVYVVTESNVGMHNFEPGTRVLYVRTSREGNRHLMSGPSGGRSITQWLAPEDFTEA